MTFITQKVNINGLSFKPWSKDAIRKFSVVEITNPQLYDNDQPSPGGLRDPLMGITARKGQCPCCKLPWSKCPGHYGHLELATPIYHAGWVDRLRKTLKSYCLHCYSPIQQRKKNCTECNKPHKVVQKHDSMYIQIDKKPLLASEALEIMKQIGEQIEYCIIEVLPIPPNCVRPSPTMGGDEMRGEDDITRTLLRVVRMNNTLKKHLKTGVESKSVLNIIKKMQEVVSSYIYRNRSSGSVTFGGKNTSIADRIRGKGGRLRNNCMGKRVNFTARTVVTGDARMGMDEVGVPQQVADTLTITENINRFNIDAWQQKIDQEISPVKYVVRADEKRLDMRFNKPTLQIGWKVERAIQNGDIALFNRQPSLHKMSIMGHKVNIMPGKTFRLNLSCTTPYNADCKYPFSSLSFFNYY